MKVKRIILAVSFFMGVQGVYAQENVPSDLGGPRFIAWNNDYQYLGNSDNRTGYWAEGLNYIPLSQNPETYLTVGGEGRWMYEYLNHASANFEPNDRNESVAQRLRLFGDLHLNKNFRLFLELGDNWAYDAEVPTPANYDAVDIQQAFFDYQFKLNENMQVGFRPGRFVMPLGSKILVSTRDGSNLQYNYDGLRAWLNYQDNLKVDVFNVKPVKFKRGSFDDQADNSREFKGIYLTASMSDENIDKANFDLYFFDMNHDRKIFTDQFGKQNRNSIGARLYGQKNNIDYDFEYVHQFGDFGEKDIQAYAVFSKFGYQIDQKFNPYIALQSMLFSGDNDLNDQKLKTFESPFSRTALFSGAAEFGLMNALFIKPSLSLNLLPKVNLTASYAVLQKQTKNDSIYHAPSGVSWNDHYQTSSKDIANITELELNYDYSRNLNFNVLFSNVDAGQALKEMGGKTNNYISVTTQFKF
ncbi:alginate export family protein [Acinetobacter tianfuensis]|nr:alginate export family protein [Acinetobacter tianfuensis]